MHIIDSLPSWAEGRGNPIPSITTDIEGNPRDQLHPDIGAFEFHGIPIEDLDSLGFISGTVFNDLNRNGFRDSNETELSRFVIQLGGTTTDYDTTDANGNFSFSYLSSGGYTIRTPVGIFFRQSKPSERDAYNVEISSTHLYSGIEFGVYDTRVSVRESESPLPTEFFLSQNYPNPFNPKTVIRYQIPLNKGGERGMFVTLKIFDVLGREIATLVNNEERNAGKYSVEFDASKLPSGIYFYRLQTEKEVAFKKMLLLK